MPQQNALEESAQTVLKPSEQTGEHHETSAKIAMALGMLDSRYKENVAAYAEALQACKREIETARAELEALLSQKRPLDEALGVCETEVDRQMHLLTHLSEEWVRKQDILTALEDELGHLSGDDSESRGMLRQRHQALDELSAQIEILEESLLKQELERQNLLLKREPLEQQIRTKQKEIKTLEAKKAYIESSQLHKITQIATPQAPLQIENV